jgi:hypothetical protein
MISHSSPRNLFLLNNHRALAETAYEDTYLTILDVDGEWADDLRAKMQPNQERTSLTTERYESM